MMALPEFDGLFKDIANHVVISLGHIGLKDKTQKIRSMSLLLTTGCNTGRMNLTLVSCYSLSMLYLSQTML